jgi:hypothetical protein
MYTINIGLANPFTGKYNTTDRTISTALQFVGGIVDIKVSTAGDEPTVIIQYTEHKGSIAVLATALDQDCIARYDHQLLRGELIGDKASEWGEFDPEQFQVCFS